MPAYEQENKGQIDAPVQQVISQLETVFEAMADGVFIYDDHERIIKTNAAGRELLGGAELYRSPSTSLQEGAERFRMRDPRGLSAKSNGPCAGFYGARRSRALRMC